MKYKRFILTLLAVFANCGYSSIRAAAGVADHILLYCPRKPY